MRGFNLKKLSSQKGFTLIEATVVLTMISILITAGAFGLYSSRRQANFKGAAQELGAEIRLSYANSISVVDNPSSDPPKAFGVSLTMADNNQYIVKNYIESAGSIIEDSNVIKEFPPGITISDIRDSSGSYGSMSFVYSTPFGRSNVVDGPSTSWSWSQDPIGDIYFITNSITDPEIIITLQDENGWTIDIDVKTKAPDVFVGNPTP